MIHPSVFPSVRDRVRSKMERDILAEVNHPFIVKLHYGESDHLQLDCSRTLPAINHPGRPGLVYRSSAAVDVIKLLSI